VPLLLIVAGTAAFLASPAWAGPGSAIDQYLESVPTADGKGDSTRDGSSAVISDQSGTVAPSGTGTPTASSPDGLPNASSEERGELDASGDQGGGDVSAPSLDPDHVTGADSAGFSTAASSSGLGELGLLLGISLVVALGAAFLVARRKRA
jgi:hypothetical protein